MSLENIKEQFNLLNSLIINSKEYWNSLNKDTQYNELLNQIEQTDFWQNKDKDLVLKDFKSIKSQKEEYDFLLNEFKNIKEFIDLFANESESEINKIEPEIKSLILKTKNFYLNLLLNQEKDSSNCFLSINSGAGGTESQDWTKMLLRMYLRFCETKKFKVNIIDEQIGEEAGIKSITLYIKGRNAFGFLKSEHGIHRLVRISPFDKNKRRHTSFSALTIIPEISLDNYKIEAKDLRIDTYRASGAGGQHINTTDSAVRITHIPTNIVIQCQNERSQNQNKETAMKMLISKVQEKKELDAKNKNKIQKDKNEWGSQIRSYILHPYKLVKDHRTKLENSNPESVLNGDLDNFIENYLKLKP